MIQLRPVEMTEKSQLWDLLQEYLGENGRRVFAATKNQDGSYSYPYFDHYWQEPTRFPFYIVDEDSVVGFVMIRRLAPVLYSIAEFYVRPHYRRAGIGRSAVTEVFETFPDNSWLISVIHENKPAFDFWMNIAERSTVQIELEIIDKRRFRWIE
ncbi:MAG: GNAT family N-acetyltransferase [Candidatus Kapaibacterium sp.]